MSKISIVPDRLAHYRLPVFQGLSKSLENIDIIVYGDLSPDSSGIKKPTLQDLEKYSFEFKKSSDFRVKGRLLVSSGSIKSTYDESEAVILWGDASSPGNWLSAALIKLFTRKRLAFWTHGLYGNESWLKKKLRCLFYGFADSLLLYGNNAKTLLKNEGFSDSTLFVINNSLNIEKQNTIYNHSLSRKPTANSDLNLVFVGRLTKVKKIALLLKAAAILRKKYNVKIDIVGDGECLNDLKALSEEMDLLDMINFYGSIYDEETLALIIMESDIMVSPGNIGLTAMHSLVYGTPVVSHANSANQMPEYEAIKPGISGELFDENNPESLAESIIQCKINLRREIITESSCRNVILDQYSLSYQSAIFKDFLRNGVELNEF